MMMPFVIRHQNDYLKTRGSECQTMYPLSFKTVVFLLFCLIYCTVDHWQHTGNIVLWLKESNGAASHHVHSNIAATLPRFWNNQLVQRTLWPKLRSQASFHCYDKLFNSIPQSACTHNFKASTQSTRRTWRSKFKQMECVDLFGGKLSINCPIFFKKCEKCSLVSIMSHAVNWALRRNYQLVKINSVLFIHTRQSKCIWWKLSTINPYKPFGIHTYIHCILSSFLICQTMGKEKGKGICY